MPSHSPKSILFPDRLKRICIALHGKDHGIATFLATCVGVTNSTASKYLNGHVQPDTTRMPKIAEKLGVSVDWLEGRCHEVPKPLRDIETDPDDSLIGEAAGIVLFYAIRLRPTIRPDELEKLMMTTYQRLKTGEPRNAITGDVADELAK